MGSNKSLFVTKRVKCCWFQNLPMKSSFSGQHTLSQTSAKPEKWALLALTAAHEVGADERYEIHFATEKKPPFFDPQLNPENESSLPKRSKVQSAAVGNPILMGSIRNIKVLNSKMNLTRKKGSNMTEGNLKVGNLTVGNLTKGQVPSGQVPSGPSFALLAGSTSGVPERSFPPTNLLDDPVESLAFSSHLKALKYYSQEPTSGVAANMTEGPSSATERSRIGSSGKLDNSSRLFSFDASEHDEINAVEAGPRNFPSSFDDENFSFPHDDLKSSLLLRPFEMYPKERNFIGKTDNFIIKIASSAQIERVGTREKVETREGRPVKVRYGEVENSETVSYKDFKHPHPGGLYCSRTFGPVKNWVCTHPGCSDTKKGILPVSRKGNDEFLGAPDGRGKYREFKCSVCGNGLYPSTLRRYRMGYIHLYQPLVHVSYIHSRQNLFAHLLRWKTKEIHALIYNNLNLINFGHTELFSACFAPLFGFCEDSLGEALEWLRGDYFSLSDQATVVLRLLQPTETRNAHRLSQAQRHPKAVKPGYTSSWEIAEHEELDWGVQFMTSAQRSQYDNPQEQKLLENQLYRLQKGQTQWMKNWPPEPDPDFLKTSWENSQNFPKKIESLRAPEFATVDTLLLEDQNFLTNLVTQWKKIFTVPKERDLNHLEKFQLEIFEHDYHSVPGLQYFSGRYANSEEGRTIVKKADLPQNSIFQAFQKKASEFSPNLSEGLDFPQLELFYEHTFGTLESFLKNPELMYSEKFTKNSFFLIQDFFTKFQVQFFKRTVRRKKKFPVKKIEPIGSLGSHSILQWNPVKFTSSRRLLDFACFRKDAQEKSFLTASGFSISPLKPKESYARASLVGEFLSPPSELIAPMKSSSQLETARKLLQEALKVANEIGLAKRKVKSAEKARWYGRGWGEPVPRAIGGYFVEKIAQNSWRRDRFGVRGWKDYYGTMFVPTFQSNYRYRFGYNWGREAFIGPPNPIKKPTEDPIFSSLEYSFADWDSYNDFELFQISPRLNSEQYKVFEALSEFKNQSDEARFASPAGLLKQSRDFIFYAKGTRQARKSLSNSRVFIQSPPPSRFGGAFHYGMEQDKYVKSEEDDEEFFPNDIYQTRFPAIFPSFAWRSKTFDQPMVANKEGSLKRNRNPRNHRFNLRSGGLTQRKPISSPEPTEPTEPMGTQLGKTKWIAFVGGKPPLPKLPSKLRRNRPLKKPLRFAPSTKLLSGVPWRIEKVISSFNIFSLFGWSSKKWLPLYALRRRGRLELNTNVFLRSDVSPLCGLHNMTGGKPHDQRLNLRLRGFVGSIHKKPPALISLAYSGHKNISVSKPSDEHRNRQSASSRSTKQDSGPQVMSSSKTKSQKLSKKAKQAQTKLVTKSVKLIQPKVEFKMPKRSEKSNVILVGIKPNQLDFLGRKSRLSGLSKMFSLSARKTNKIANSQTGLRSPLGLSSQQPIVANFIGSSLPKGPVWANTPLELENLEKRINIPGFENFETQKEKYRKKLEEFHKKNKGFDRQKQFASLGISFRGSRRMTPFQVITKISESQYTQAKPYLLSSGIGQKLTRPKNQASKAMNFFDSLGVSLPPAHPGFAQNLVSSLDLSTPSKVKSILESELKKPYKVGHLSNDFLPPGNSLNSMKRFERSRIFDRNDVVEELENFFGPGNWFAEKTIPTQFLSQENQFHNLLAFLEASPFGLKEKNRFLRRFHSVFFNPFFRLFISRLRNQKRKKQKLALAVKALQARRVLQGKSTRPKAGTLLTEGKLTVGKVASGPLGAANEIGKGNGRKAVVAVGSKQSSPLKLRGWNFSPRGRIQEGDPLYSWLPSEHMMQRVIKLLGNASLGTNGPEMLLSQQPFEILRLKKGKTQLYTGIFKKLVNGKELSPLDKKAKPKPRKVAQGEKEGTRFALSSFHRQLQNLLFQKQSSDGFKEYHCEEGATILTQLEPTRPSVQASLRPEVEPAGKAELGPKVLFPGVMLAAGVHKGSALQSSFVHEPEYDLNHLFDLKSPDDFGPWKRWPEFAKFFLYNGGPTLKKYFRSENWPKTALMLRKRIRRSDPSVVFTKKISKLFETPKYMGISPEKWKTFLFVKPNRTKPGLVKDKLGAYFRQQRALLLAEEKRLTKEIRRSERERHHEHYDWSIFDSKEPERFQEYEKIREKAFKEYKKSYRKRQKVTEKIRAQERKAKERLKVQKQKEKEKQEKAFARAQLKAQKEREKEKKEQERLLAKALRENEKQQRLTQSKSGKNLKPANRANMTAGPSSALPEGKPPDQSLNLRLRGFVGSAGISQTELQEADFEPIQEATGLISAFAEVSPLLSDETGQSDEEATLLNGSGLLDETESSAEEKFLDDDDDLFEDFVKFHYRPYIKVMKADRISDEAYYNLLEQTEKEIENAKKIAASKAKRKTMRPNLVYIDSVNIEKVFEQFPFSPEDVGWSTDIMKKFSNTLSNPLWRNFLMHEMFRRNSMRDQQTLLKKDLVWEDFVTYHTSPLDISSLRQNPTTSPTPRGCLSRMNALMDLDHAIKRYDLTTRKADKKKADQYYQRFDEYLKAFQFPTAFGRENVDTNPNFPVKKRTRKIADKKRLIKQYRAVLTLLKNPSCIERGVFDKFPILPPDLRPILQLGDVKAVSDMTALYILLIQRNLRHGKILFESYGESNEFLIDSKTMVQVAADNALDKCREKNVNNLIVGRMWDYKDSQTQLEQWASAKPKTKGPGSLAGPIPPRTLYDRLSGKEGRFRMNLLGKRVDYSGRSVIIVGPSLNVDQCGLPYEMAFELFQPFVLRYMLEDPEKKVQKYLQYDPWVPDDTVLDHLKWDEAASSSKKGESVAIGSASSVDPRVFGSGSIKSLSQAKLILRKKKALGRMILRQIVPRFPVLLNRAPTLHRLGIQGFHPVLVYGRALHLHPLVCGSFNADFDGDQMAVHIPLSLKARFDIRMLMFAPVNWLSPATGQPTVVPSQDMVLGLFYMTLEKIALQKGRGAFFQTLSDAVQAYQTGMLEIQSQIWVKWNGPFANNQMNDESSEEVYDEPKNTDSQFRRKPFFPENQIQFWKSHSVNLDLLNQQNPHDPRQLDSRKLDSRKLDQRSSSLGSSSRQIPYGLSSPQILSKTDLALLRRKFHAATFGTAGEMTVLARWWHDFGDSRVFSSALTRRISGRKSEEVNRGLSYRSVKESWFETARRQKRRRHSLPVKYARKAGFFYHSFGRFSNDEDEPLEIRVHQTGNSRKIYADFQWSEDSKEENRMCYIRTTPGRALMNQLIYPSYEELQDQAVRNNAKPSSFG